MISISFLRRSFFMRSGAFAVGLLVLVLMTLPATAQNRTRKVSGVGSPTAKPSAAKPAATTKQGRRKKGDDEIKGVTTTGDMGIQRVNAEVMQTELFAPPSKRPPLMPEREVEGFEDRPQNPNAPAVSSWPVMKLKRGTVEASRFNNLLSPLAPQTIGLNFTGPTLTDTGSFPPDTMGAVGPTQVVVFVNGRIRTFNKTTGAADGVMNANPDNFFNSVMTPPVASNFTSDPMVRYDRLSGRWFVSIIDVPGGAGALPNRWMVAVSDTASNGTITGATVWTYFFVTTDAANFCDYPSLGIDSKALYFGCNMFDAAGTFAGTNGYVVRKTSVTGAGPIVSTAFANMAPGIGAGPYSPRGVDNYDPVSNEGYFIGVDNASFSTIVLRRITDPGGSPTISGNISITVPLTTSSIAIQHLGNTGANNGRIDTLDDRLYSAHIRNGRLWTSHNIRVGTTGVGSTSATSREAVRWYELNGIRSVDNGGVPVLIQSGTIFDSAATLAASRQFSIPSVMVSGQGHAAFGFTTTGSLFAIDAATNGRLAGDTLGTTQAFVNLTSSTFAYNPVTDPGPPRRWGDYSYTSLDPLDDMTMWTVQEFCNATNNYAVRVTQLRAPLPVTPTGTNPVNAGLVSVNVVITGASPAGQGFYDPGANLASPALAFNHIAASVTGGVIVNSVTYNSPTQITLNLNTTGAANGAQTLTITNPDGQTSTGTVTINPPLAADAVISGRVTSAEGRGLRNVLIRLISPDGSFTRQVITGRNGFYNLGEVPTGAVYIITPTARRFSFDPANLVYEHRDEISNLNFTGQP